MSKARLRMLIGKPVMIDKRDGKIAITMFSKGRYATALLYDGQPEQVYISAAKALERELRG